MIPVFLDKGSTKENEFKHAHENILTIPLMYIIRPPFGGYKVALLHWWTCIDLPNNFTKMSIFPAIFSKLFPDVSVLYY